MNHGVLTVVVGLPGSGKSTLVAKIRPFVSGVCVEDFHADAIGNSPLVEHSRYYRPLIEAIRAGRDCVIADIAFCDPDRRSNLENTIATQTRTQRIEWIYFENAPEKCKRNIQRRNRPSRNSDLEALDIFARLYVIPEGGNPRPVYTETT